MTPKSRYFHEFLTFLDNSQDALRKLLGCVGRVLECLRASGLDFLASMTRRKNDENFRIFLKILGVISDCSSVSVSCKACIARYNRLFRWHWLASAVRERN